MFKKNLFILLFVMVGFFIGCEKEKIFYEPNDLSYINLSDGEIAKMVISGNKLKEKYIYTKFETGIGSIVLVDYPEGQYEIEVFFKNKNFTLKTDLFLYKNEEINLTITKDFKIYIKNKQTPTTKYLKLSEDQKRKKGEIEAGFRGFIEADTKKAYMGLEYLSTMSKAGKVKAKHNGTELTTFDGANDLKTKFNLTLIDDLISDIFRQVEFIFTTQQDEDDFKNYSLNSVNIEYEKLLPTPPQNLVVEQFKNYVKEDERYITPEGEAPIDKINPDNSDKIYFYAGVIGEATTGNK